MKSSRSLLSLIFISTVISACSMTSKPPVFSEDRHVGVYKVGQPYQIDGTWYTPEIDEEYEESGIASWYGPGFHKKLTANGDKFDQHALTAAHRTLPMPSMVRVTNEDNGRSLVVMVNDRGPFSKGRIIDLSERAADILDFKKKGIANVKVKFLPGQTRRLLAQLDVPEGEGNPFATADADFGMQAYESEAGVVNDGLDLPLPPNFNISSTASNASSNFEPAVMTDNDAPIGISPEFDRAESAVPKNVMAGRIGIPENALGEPAWQPEIMTKEVEMAETNQVLPSQLAPNDALEVAQEQDVDDVEATVIIPDDKILLSKDDPRFVEEIYYIQVGSYGVEDNAMRAKNTLLPLGEKVDVAAISTASGNISRVQVGPIFKEDRAKQLLKAVTTMGYPDAIIVNK